MLLTPKPQSPHALPIYVQIAELITRNIVAGRLIDGQRLPPEREMASDLGVSVGTLRKSLQALAEKGLLERIHGSGNYVRAGGDTGSVYAMFRLELLDGGGLPSADVLNTVFMMKPADLPAFGTSEAATRFRRIRYLNDVVIAAEEIWLDGNAGKIDETAISESLYVTYREQLGLLISRAQDRVGIASVPSWVPEVFSLPPGATTGYIERLTWSEAEAPIEFSRTWFDADRAGYVQRMK